MTSDHIDSLGQLPSLRALRGFEAAARHLNLVRAGAELGITQGALSRQIKALEEHLGVQLFTRTPRGLVFTEAGDNLWDHCRRAFSMLGEGIDSVGKVRKRETLVVAIARSFATRRLAQRVGDFVERYPWIELRLDGHRHLADLSRDADVAIRVGDGRWPGLHVESLGTDPIVPVAAPSVLRRTGSEPSFEALSRETLLHFMDRDLWGAWATGRGLESPIAQRNVYFSETIIMLEAAEAGQGIAVGRQSLVKTAISRGTIVPLYSALVDDGYGYFLCCVPEALNRRKVALFRQWLLGT
ncbi:Transcriptional regulator [Mesorhizobium plurifarium]|uniref:Transcriptional regulator n=1 Tax=Mesorhizobium plurifarium TaxID=69974 RepID=A0A090FJT5_MESPL|nr:Transcriptional regulator [Mesorhizobium plurifarium]